MNAEYGNGPAASAQRSLAYAGAEVAARFGGLEAEWKAIDSGAGLIDAGHRSFLLATGSERARFLHGQCSNDVAVLEPGQGCAALLLNAQGRAQSILSIYNRGEDLLLCVDRALLENTRESLERFLVADDVEFEDLPAPRVVEIAGPAAVEVLGGVGVEGLPAEAGWTLARGRIGGQELSVIGRGDLRVPCFDLLLDQGGDAGALWSTLVEAGAVAAGIEAYEIVRIESGTARYGKDIDAGRLAMEARLEWAIHFDKGCYVGQEVVERAISRGSLNRELSLVAIDGDACEGDLRADGSDSEVLTSLADSPRLGRIGLLYLARDLAETGNTVTISSAAGAVPARVLEWPRKRVLLGRD